MKFKNTTDKTLTFSLDKAYEVAPGATIEISDNVSFAVASMGLPLEATEKAKDAQVPDPSPRISNKQPTAADPSSVAPPAFHVEPPAPNAPLPGPPATEATQGQPDQRNVPAQTATNKSVRPKSG